MKNTIVRVNSTSEFPKAAYIKQVGHDGGFAFTSDKAKARTFTSKTARELITRLTAGNTRMTFTTCEAPHAQA